MQPIGLIESCYKDKFGVPRQPGLVKAATSKLRVRADLQPEQALQGLEGFSHVWLIWSFHESRTARYHAKVHPPRLGGGTLGVFATRSPHRPNPIGLSLVELIAIEGDTLILGGADLMDGTPVLDIKPYLPSVESRPDARAGWAETAERPPLDVSFSAEARAELDRWQSRRSEDLEVIIRETISLDPRPEIYRGEGEEGWLRRPNHAFRLYDGDVHFRMTASRQAEVFKILELHNELKPANLRKFQASAKSGGVANKSILPGEG